MQVGHQEQLLLHLSVAGQGALPDDDRQSGAWEGQGGPHGPLLKYDLLQRPSMRQVCAAMLAVDMRASGFRQAE